MKNRLIILAILLTVSACSTPSTSTDIAGLYTGYEQGSWYKFSRNCSAKLCDVY